MTNPIVLSLLSGLVFNLCHISLPLILTQSISQLGHTALPFALFLLGSQLASLRLTQMAPVGLAVMMKLLILPSLVWLFSALIFWLPQEAVAAITLLAASPVGVNLYTLLLGENDNAALGGAMVLSSSALCVFSLFFWQ
ncbi:AEC family transporter [Aliiglaciecola sp. CAU 1673]|uniref:AEC family transporter n=1 Tax=Aliiglaciecola sp. CAU 1673 TaxID=3032595 RepID=UPI0023DA9CA9|nr:AEC family transporter [Aliiglaciecola sp. CAU 1673]MDF2177661.1 AEC family transporter [Aliiglaciecola sp. CAU 1673]